MSHAFSCLLVLLLCTSVQAQPRRSDRAQRLVTTGRALVVAGDPGSAIAYFRQAILADRRFAPAYTQLTEVYLAQERLGNAMEVLRAGLRRRPDAAELHLLLARVLTDRGDLEEAAQVLRELVVREPRSVAGHAQRAILARDRGAWSEALASYRAIVALAACRDANCPVVSAEMLRSARQHVAALQLLANGVDPISRCEGSVVRRALCQRSGSSL